jgi:hypothetical protein
VDALMPDSETVRPALDDAYWFAYSKELVDKAITSRNEQAARLQNLVVWLWGIYTASAAVGLTLGKAHFGPLTTAFIALPSLLLIVAYVFAVGAQTPIDVEFDVQSATKIKNAYTESVNRKKKFLGRAHLLSFVAGIFVGIALIVASFAKQAPSPEFAAQTKASLLTVWGRGIDCKDTIAIRLLPKDPSLEKPMTKNVLCAANGEFVTEFELKPGSEWKGALVEVKWADPKDKNISHAVTREIQ